MKVGPGGREYLRGAADSFRRSRLPPQHEKSRIDKALQALAKTRVGGWLFITVFPTRCDHLG
jgi:hypothetical protein